MPITSPLPALPRLSPRRRQDGSGRKSDWPQVRSVQRPPGPVGNPGELRCRPRLPTGFQTVSMPRFKLSPDREDYDADTLSFISRMDSLQNQECMFDFLPQCPPLIQSKRPGQTSHLIGCRSQPGRAKLGELPGVTVTGSVPDVRRFIPIGCHGCATQHRPRHPEQDFWGRMCMGVPVVNPARQVRAALMP